MKPNRYAESVDFNYCWLDSEIDEIMELTKGAISKETAAAIVCRYNEDRDVGAVAAEFFRILIWLSEGQTVQEIGQRCLACLYVMRPDLVGHATLEQIGLKSQTTRAAIDKYVTDFRDMFGIEGEHVRKKLTRKQCHKAQFNW